MRPIGLILLWSGFLVAAFFAVQNLENESQPWRSVDWLKYGGAMAVGIIGVVILRLVAAWDRQDVHRTEAEYSTLDRSIKSLVAEVKTLQSQQDKLSPAQIVTFIDEKCVESFADFADARSAISKRFGLSTYAEIMTEFAAGERYVNRSWSAAADGYVDEVRSCVDRALGHLEAAKSLMTQAEKGSV